MFVNNEKTLLKIYEILFPHRANANPGASNMAGVGSELGSQVYGSNAVKAFNSSVNASVISVQNIEMLNQIGGGIEA